MSLFSSSFPAPTRLHIPDGFLSAPVLLITWLLAIILIAIAIRRTRAQLGERQIPLMGVMAAFIFAAQMINFPVAGGTSGHLLGGALAAITLGPWAGMLVMTAVITVQALLFQDGGLLAIGANLLNMGLLTALIGYGLFHLAPAGKRRLRLGLAGLAAWLSVIAGALATALELWLSGTSPLRLVVPAMLGVHALIGIGEALITVAALSFLSRLRPELIQANSSARGDHGWALAGLLASLGVLLLAPLASANPDGLERVALNLGFASRSAGAPFQVLPGYSLPSLGDTPLSTWVAGATGLVIVALVTALADRLLRRPPAENRRSNSH